MTKNCAKYQQIISNSKTWQFSNQIYFNYCAERKETDSNWDSQHQTWLQFPQPWPVQWRNQVRHRADETQLRIVYIPYQFLSHPPFRNDSDWKKTLRWWMWLILQAGNKSSERGIDQSKWKHKYANAKRSLDPMLKVVYLFHRTNNSYFIKGNA